MLLYLLQFILASYEWNGVEEAFEIQLTNSSEIKWINNNKTG